MAHPGSGHARLSVAVLSRDGSYFRACAYARPHTQKNPLARFTHGYARVMAESGLLLNITTSDIAKPILRRSRKRFRVVNSADADNVSTRSKIPPPLAYELKQKVDNGIGLQSFFTKR